MPKYTVAQLREELAGHDQDDKIVAVIWAREDFPRVWDRIAAAYNHHWDETLITATAEVLAEHCRHELDIELSEENEDS
jgi:hypothetical protein